MKKYSGKPISFVLHKNSELGLEKQYFEYMAQGKAVDYAHRLAGAHVDLLQGGAVHRRAVPVPRPDALEQGARRRHAQARGRRDRAEGRRDADRLRRRRHAQHLRQQAGAQPAGDEGPQGPRAGRADLEPHLPGGRHGADRDRVQRGLQRDPERRHRRGRERGGGRRAMKFYEVAPNLSMTQHAITIRPLCFSGKTFKGLDKAMQISAHTIYKNRYKCLFLSRLT